MLDCSEAYGTGYATVYSLDGSRYVPGDDHTRPGGDVWTADAALERGRANTAASS